LSGSTVILNAMSQDHLDEIKSLLTPPARRNVNEMQLQISELTPGAHVGATFVSPVFGIYVMWGDVARASHGDFVISVFSIESKGKPANDVVRLSMSGQSIAAVGSHEIAPGLDHGTIVRATFIDGGSFINVLGPAVVATAAPMIGVGAWVLAYKGNPGVHLKALDVVAPPDELGLTYPPTRRSWHDATTGSAS